MEQFEKKLSVFVPSQFPQFYNSEGPQFVDFVKHYYEWLEGNSAVANTSWELNGVVTINSSNIYVKGIGTDFTEIFVAGDQIAIITDPDENDYDIFTVNSVVNTSCLVLETAPTTSIANTPYYTVQVVPNALYYSRNFFEIKDIDTTSTDFLVYFKEKYFKNIKFDTVVDIRFVLKHIVDVYRSKGSDRAINLLYKIVYGKDAKIFYPGQHLFNTSAGRWHVPRYLELSLKDTNKELVGRQVTGSVSGATAFAESIIRKNVNGKIIELLFISGIKGTFRYGEKLTSKYTTYSTSPTIIGSLNQVDIDIDGAGVGFTLYDEVDVYSDNGDFAKAKVTEIAVASGRVDYDFVDGGYGYTNGAQLFISEKIVVVSNTRTTNTITYFEIRDQFTQPYVQISYEWLSGGEFALGDYIYTYWPNTDVKGIGQIMTNQKLNSNSGIMFVTPISGDIDEPTIATSGNVVTANLTIGGYVDYTAFSNVVGYYSNTTLECTNRTGTFEVGEEIIQDNNQHAIGTINATSISVNGSTLYAVVDNFRGAFLTGERIRGLSSNATANLQSAVITVGIQNLNNTFISTEYNRIESIGPASTTTGTITTIGSGTGANAIISNSYIYQETLLYNDEYLAPYLSVQLNASQYGFPDNPTANMTSNTSASPVVLADIIIPAYFTVGKATGFTSTIAGEDYNFPPVVRLYDPYIYTFMRPDTEYLVYTGASSGYIPGEQLTSEALGSKGIVNSIVNSTCIEVQLLNFLEANQFVLTTNSTTTIFGEDSGTTANVVAIIPKRGPTYFGLDTIILTSTFISNSGVAAVEITDSGYGFQQDEQVYLVGAGNNIATGISVLGDYGRSKGFYKDRNSFTSNVKKLQDGYYWQNFSYDVYSSVINKSKRDLKSITHPAGMAYFDTIDYSTNNMLDITTTTTVTIT